MIRPQRSEPTEPGLPLHRRPGFLQFLKFIIVGASSFLVNFGVSFLLYYKLRLALVPALSIAFFLSVLNGFFWNRRWTFKQARSKPVHTQSLQFFVVSIIGWLLNTSIVVVLIALFTGHFGDPEQFRRIVMVILTNSGKHQYGFGLFYGSLLIATGVVVFWNFFANRFWTFKH